MSDPPKFNFSGASAPSLFGSANNANANTGSGLFGNKAADSNKSSPFGQPPAVSTPTGGSFSFAKPTSVAAPGLFGAAASTGGTPTASGFNFGPKQDGNPTTPAATVTPNFFGGSNASTGAGAFGNQAAAASTPANPANKPSLFSTTPAGPPPSQPNSLFGGQKPQAPSTGALFGQKPAETPTATMFSQKPQDTTTPSSTPMFGQKPAESSSAAAKPTGGLFSNTPSAAPAPTNLFGQKPAESSSAKPMFGGMLGAQKPAESPSNSQPSGGLFGAKPAAASSPSTTPAPGGLFGQKPADSSAPPASGGLFSQKPAESTSTAAPAKPMFGSAPQSAPAPKPSFSLGGTSTASQPSAAQPATSTSGTTPSLFGNAAGAPAASQPATSNSVTTPSLFGNVAGAPASAAPAAPASAGTSAPSLFAAKKDEPSTSSAPSTSGTGLFASPAAAPSTAAKPSTTPAFSLGNSSTTTPASTSNPTGATPNGLGASTSGPAPPATSRLNSKSLDEIITLWTTSLSTHQKNFANLANKIGSWDRMLVENSDKISKLYSRTFQAERDTAEVERQLATVEGQQDELSHWLDHYEKVLDDMAAKTGGVESGIDAERERTYRTAERCSTRLTTMSHDLTSMIEEINLASTNLSKSNKTADSDPLSQIVRVLNAHLTQLQQIDVGAEALRQKVEAAQKEVRGFGGRVGDEGGVEGFLRSLRR